MLLDAAWSLGAVFIAAALCGVLSFACLFVAPNGGRQS
jgi:hypothetical protein